MNRPRLSWIVAAAIGVTSGALLTSGVSCSIGGDDLGIGGGLEGAVATGYGTSAVGGDANINPDGENPPKKYDYSALCGRGDCVPGSDARDCADTGSAATGTGAATSAVTGTGVGGAGESGAGGAFAVAAVSAAAGTSGGTGGFIETSCQVVADGDTATSVCAPAGAGLSNDACRSSSDCAPGLGCVSTKSSDGTGPDVSLCRPYCCGDLEACFPNDGTDPGGEPVTFCTPRPMSENPARTIPVCLPVTSCVVFDQASCPSDQTCTVVRTSGATSCVDKGTGAQCEACPCASGFMCSPTGVCLELCHTSGNDTDECNGGVCQGGVSNLPVGVGQCVGAGNDCATK